MDSNNIVDILVLLLYC